ncbi:MAG: hypothetical protein KJ064_06140 [Anaerolineae bacterium]|jgi:hypothetical protein|nr:hypothetical protein [Anaerolineae bacterium]
MISKLAHPTIIGILLVGIAFNIILSILGLLGIKLVDAFYLTLILLTIIGSLAAQVLIYYSRKVGE